MQEKIEALEVKIVELETTIASLETDADASEVRGAFGAPFVRCVCVVCVILAFHVQDKITKMNAKIIELEQANATLGTGGDVKEVRARLCGVCACVVCALVCVIWILAFHADEGGVRDTQ